MKKGIYVLIWLLLLPSLSFAQQGKDPYSINNDADSTISQIAEAEPCPIDTVELLNDSIVKLSQQLSHYRDTIQSLKKKIISLNDEKTYLQSELKKRINDLNAIDSIVYKQCLIRPLYRRYSKEEIDELLHCLSVMSIEKSYKDDYETYHHLLDNYSTYNNEVISFLERQKKRINAILAGGATIDWKDFDDTANRWFDKLSYSKYYKRRTSPPWESITYLDEVIEDFFKQIQSSKLSEESIQELIGRLTPKS